MKEINLRVSDKEITKIINSSSENNVLSAEIIGLTTNGKNKVRLFIQRVLEKYNAHQFSSDATYIILELLFNSIKAMYAHVLTVSNLKMLSPSYCDEIDDDSYLEDAKIMRSYNEIQANPINKNHIKDIMRLEGEIFNLLNHNTYSNHEKYKHLHFIKKLCKKKPSIKLIFEIKDNYLIFSILNETPITEYAINRIEDKRKTFREYYNNDKVDMFFIERLDNTESAGFGIAIIDLKLLTLGLEPDEHFKILPYNNSNTLTILKFPKTN